MVVPVSTDFSRALTEPLEVIQDLFDKSSGGGETFTADVQKHFDQLFHSEELRSKVPFLTSSLLAQQVTVPAKLVRWRCMVQDTSLGNEVLPRQFRVSGASTPRNGLFGATSLSPSSAAEAPPADGSGGFGSLTTLCGVSIPGETAWARGADEGGGAGVSATSSLSDKIPRGEGSAVLLKLYDEQLAESLHVTQIVDLLGVVDHSALPSADWASMGSAEPSSSTADASHPTLHVISLRSVEEEKVTLDGDATAARAELIQYLSQALAGDNLASEWLLLALLARIHTRSAANTMGSLSVNIYGFPTPPILQGGDEKVALYHALQAVLPLLADQSLELEHLNTPSTRFAPKSDADERGVRAGRLQLVPGTTLFIDEGTMNEGQLKDNGIANIRALSTVLQTHKLPYTFPFSTHEMDTDLPCVVVSQGKSFLPVDVQVPLQPATADAAATLFQKPAAETGAGSGLNTSRRYLQAVQQRSARSDAFTIPPDVSDRIQDDFVEIRKKNQVHTGAAAEVTAGAPPLTLLDTQEDLARTIQVARLICLSHGQSSLRWDDWQAAKRLDEERQRRMV